MNKTLPAIHLTVRPFGTDEKIDKLAVEYKIRGVSLADGEELLRINHETVSIPFCPLSGLTAADESGSLDLTEASHEQYPVIFRSWRIARPSAGALTINYVITPREVPPGYRSSPYFDFRNEKGGANGAGITFLAEFNAAPAWVWTFDWDLTAMPAGSTGVSSFGDGSFTAVGKPDLLKTAFYAVGQISSITNGEFGFYWFAQPPFDVREAADWTQQMFRQMAAFFGDSSLTYRIFMRKDPFEISGGGTALPRSYLFGYSDAMVPSLNSLKNMLAHEMAHNWVQLADEPYGSGTWCTEGMTEFFCVVLPLRFGLATMAETLQQIQDRTDRYYTSPVRHLTNAEAARLSWQDRRTQRIPYGRGFFYIAGLDVRIRRATGGRHSIDDVARRMYRLFTEGKTADNDKFISLVAELSGLDICDDFTSMCAGASITPESDSFDGHFSCRPTAAAEADTGEPVTSWVWSIKDSEAGDTNEIQL